MHTTEAVARLESLHMAMRSSPLRHFGSFAWALIFGMAFAFNKPEAVYWIAGVVVVWGLLVQPFLYGLLPFSAAFLEYSRQQRARWKDWPFSGPGGLVAAGAGFMVTGIVMYLAKLDGHSIPVGHFFLMGVVLVVIGLVALLFSRILSSRSKNDTTTPT